MKYMFRAIPLGPAAAALLAAALLAAAVAVAQVVEAEREKPAAAPQASAATGKAAREADEKVIRQSADEFVKACNAADVKAVGALWSDDAEYADELGQSYQGRAAIEELYAGVFKEHPGATMTVKIESIRFLGPDTAIEKGITTLNSPSGESSAARYTVVHARRDGKWVMVDCHDSPYVPGVDEDVLKDLEWLVGDWIVGPKDEGRRVKFQWLCGRNFIKGDSTLTQGGKTTVGGGRIIGWNPKLGKIVSLHYDAQGGFGNDVWTKDGSKWVIEASGLFRDGSESTAVNVITPTDANSFTWASAGRTLDGVELPDIPPVKVVRAAAGK
ncbi:MAG: YybH family protein [Thermoguttaceae bacterium]